MGSWLVVSAGPRDQVGGKVQVCGRAKVTYTLSPAPRPVLGSRSLDCEEGEVAGTEVGVGAWGLGWHRGSRRPEWSGGAGRNGVGMVLSGWG